MIARSWTGITTAEGAITYLAHLKQKVFPALDAIEGHGGAYVLQRRVQGRVEFTVVTIWDSMEAVQRFAGRNPDLAVVEPEAKAQLLEFDDRVSHYDIVYASQQFMAGRKK